ncbi:hypothetical protein FG385_20875 [Amycolatopsis alkalitolerans]|uniref:ClpX-type ZB domain-containing protein n=1 Tax=Amycolatopsis alkalitolerans TaxID=2547244 RepID=A0A5C4LXE5_9PSEU|nr:hypothetical protein FG385_20875 [Amycolatopsis alkalitolerans]
MERTENTEHLVNGRTALCRFCDRPGAKGLHRAPGPLGPICPDCLDTGRALCQDGRERSLRGPKLARLVTAPGVPCEFCGRSRRHGVLRHHRPLPRMRCIPGEAVICADCLARGTQLLARVTRVCRPRIL